jgi:hypothetical protein
MTIAEIHGFSPWCAAGTDELRQRDNAIIIADAMMEASSATRI